MNMENQMQRIEESADFLKKAGIDKPEIGIVLGTGLGKLVDEIEVDKIIEYEDIPDFPVSTVEFHHGKLISGKLSGKKVLAMKGRFHYYEGYTMQQITFPIRVMKFLGIKNLLLSNAAGTVNPDFKKGELMLIDDHINLLGDNPLIGENLDELGVRFPDMSEPYSKEINKKLAMAAEKFVIRLNKGVYAAVAGPNLETRAEYRYMRRIGADVIGMSTIPEVIVANHMKLPVAAVSVITDECDPDNLAPIDVKELLEVAALAEKDLIKVFTEVIRVI